MRGLIVLALAGALAGCATPTPPPPGPSLDGTRAVRKANLPPLAIGEFTAAPGAPTEMDRSIASRAGVQAAPGGSYAHYLGQVIAADLRNAGALDASSALKVEGTITHAELHSPIGTGHGELAARIRLSRNGVLMFEKSYDAKAAWPSDFVGAAAISDAFNHYMGLFDELALDIFADPEFSASARSVAASH